MDEPLKVQAILRELRGLGITIAIDDFGTGYSSLSYLDALPVDIIKIDRSFVARLGIDRASDVVVGSLIDIARKLDMRLVAEGIETTAQASMLCELGCTMGQGYLFSRACSFEDTTQLLTLFAQTNDDPVLERYSA
jgi:EAL domain-containing protein (putative c-di-GMP-specific phosphodiesterase class I)